MKKIFALKYLFFILVFISSRGLGQDAAVIGYVSYQLEFLRDDRIYVEAFNDPKIRNVVCYVSRAILGGVKGVTGLVTEPSRVNVSCMKTGPIKILKPLDESKTGESVFEQSESWAFKELKVTRFVDVSRRMLVYLIWTTKIYEGSPIHSISVVSVDIPK